MNEVKTGIKFRIPILLIWFRMFCGVAILMGSIFGIDSYIVVAITFLTLGLLSDIFDGIIARRLGIATQRLRRLDSSVDQLFFIMVGIATYLQCPAFFKDNSLWIGVVLVLEALTYVISFIKFRREIATHTIGAKGWSLLLFATLVEVIIHCNSNVLFFLFVVVGIVTRIEIMVIILILKKWTNDVPSVFQAVRFRKEQK